ncbi:hypothetical protein CEXT_168391 [Caerostris extrusa]|uniref:Uncharacterized protein n=1 Tax=Caerostris extrusa TaxID=172846 RepID=A0AAV4Y4Q5_CAEEX|nr:hypothetical protein CEXT_168391 [Caerostris extrusa]
MIMSPGDYEMQLKYWTTSLPQTLSSACSGSHPLFSFYCVTSPLDLSKGGLPIPLIPLHNTLSLHRRSFPMNNACEVSSRGARIRGG